MKILHLITGLNLGGAEKNLLKICEYDFNNTHTVVSLTTSGLVSLKLRKINIKVYHLNFSTLPKFFSSFQKFKTILKKEKPDIIQTWMYHADFIGSIFSKLFFIKNLVWNIRHSDFSFRKSKLKYLFLVKILAIFSWFFPKKIISCSRKASLHHISKGYNKKKFIFIPNGYDPNIYKLSKKKFFFVRKKYNISHKTPLLANVARFDPQKDHYNLLKSLFLLTKENIDFFCFLIGIEKKYEKKLLNFIKYFNLEDKVKILNKLENINRIISEVDFHVLQSSFGEGFPNVVAETMLLKTPNIVTDVGDAKFIVKKNGWVVSPNNSNDLKEAIKKVIFLLRKPSWKSRCESSRKIIIKNYPINKMLREYNLVWKNI